MNFVALTGRLTKDFNIYNTQGGMTIGKTLIAVDKGYGEKKKTSFIGITVFGKTAESCSKFIGKGDLVEVTGSIDTGSYKKSDGTTVYTTDILVDDLKKLSGSNRNSEAHEAPKRDDFVKYASSEAESVAPTQTTLDENMPF